MIADKKREKKENRRTKETKKGSQNMIKACIFDLDGTILNTLEDLAAAGNHTCEMHGWPTFAVDEYRYKVGNGMLKLVERFMPAEYAGDGRMFEQTLAEFRAYYGEHKEDHTAPYAGTIEMLDRLRAAGVQLAVLTNKDHVSAAPLIEKYFGSERFALVQGRVDAFPPKPEAPVTLHVMEELGADPATTLYVGDSCWDTYKTDASALQVGLISRYAGSEDTEDFVELISIYVTRPQEAWDKLLTTAGADGGHHQPEIRDRPQLPAKQLEHQHRRTARVGTAPCGRSPRHGSGIPRRLTKKN